MKNIHFYQGQDLEEFTIEFDNPLKIKISYNLLGCNDHYMRFVVGNISIKVADPMTSESTS